MLSGRTTLRSFFATRFRRLAPALFLLLLVATIAAYVFVLPPSMQLFAKSLIAQPFYLQNIVFWNEGDYFRQAPTKPLLHTWSLAVGEQFYVVFGLFILLLRPAPKLFLPLLFIAMIGSVVVGIMLEPVSPKTSFFMLPTRVWQLALGVFAYVIASRLGRRQSGWIDGLAVLGLIVCVAMGFLYSENTPFPGPHAYIACAATVAVLVCFDVGPNRFSMLRLSPMLYIGKLSYGFYLWHWPPITIFFLALDRHPNAIEALALIAVAFGGACLSYHFIEQPIRQRRFLGSAKAMNRFVVGGMVTTAAVGSFLYTSGGGLFRYPAEMQPFFAAVANEGTYRCPKSFRIANPTAEICPLTNNTEAGGVLVLGDSHADVLDEMLTEIADRNQRALYLTVRSCDLGMFGRFAFCPPSILEKIASEAKAKGISRILAISRWPQDWMIASDFENQTELLLDSGFDITIMEAVPYGPFFDPIRRVQETLGGHALRFDGLDRNIYVESISLQREIFRGAIDRFGDRVQILKPVGYLCPEGVCLFHTDGLPNYMDHKHLNFTGRQLLAPMFEDFFASLGRG